MKVIDDRSRVPPCIKVVLFILEARLAISPADIRSLALVGREIHVTLIDRVEFQGDLPCPSP